MLCGQDRAEEALVQAEMKRRREDEKSNNIIFCAIRDGLMVLCSDFRQDTQSSKWRDFRANASTGKAPSLKGTYVNG